MLCREFVALYKTARGRLVSLDHDSVDTCAWTQSPNFHTNERMFEPRQIKHTAGSTLHDGSFAVLDLKHVTHMPALSPSPGDLEYHNHVGEVRRWCSDVVLLT
ncbi:hypothetical protein TNCV_1169031 [Trichonephila clavipes]|uniref:Uncharacterized protein n=1 Tax=Trichonephila clavipes TaxID=2585209 RepID=A0A8X6VT08_TRICX|nr:hypothetical protein TNCV_1169031 [Trichonephila clavipes]